MGYSKTKSWKNGSWKGGDEEISFAGWGHFFLQNNTKYFKHFDGLMGVGVGGGNRMVDKGIGVRGDGGREADGGVENLF